MRENRYMDNVTLQKANELFKEMEKTRIQIERWDRAATWSPDGVLTRDEKGVTIWAVGGPNTFEIVKELSLAHWRSQLEAQENEFADLKPGEL